MIKDLSAGKAALLFAALLLFQLNWWTAVPLFAHHAPPLDAVEMYSWSLAPQWGYYKHPPLPVWAVAASTALFGKTLFALLAPSALAVALTYLAVWLIARRMFPARLALAGVMLGTLSLFCNLWATDFNHNVAQMPVWAWTLAAFYFALTSQGKGRAWWWLLCGALLGANALAKYTAALMIPPALFLLAFDRGARRNLSTGRFLLGALGCALVFLPHLVWLVRNDWMPLHYVAERMQKLATQTSWAAGFSSFIAYLLISHLFILIAAAWLGRGAPPDAAASLSGTSAEDARRVFNRRFLVVMGLGPLVVALMFGLAGKPLHPMWSSAMLPLAGLLAVGWLEDRLGADEATRRLWRRRCLAGWLALQLVFGASYVIKSSAFYYGISQKSARAVYPGPALARAVLDAWNARFPGKPLRYVAGPTWEGGVVSFFAGKASEGSLPAPLALTDGDFTLTPWIAPEDVRRCGLAAVALSAADLGRLARTMGAPLEVLPTLRIAPSAPVFPTEELGLALLAPAGDCPVQ
ncbi:MAG: glycosyltransferase family 39 protein [Candidatus Protistobacter heckmanni]|nr:glycosyltransferase family 39 protein [Candidatus Protistobacter heckmanni]